MTDFKDVKIIKSCKQNEEDPIIVTQDCKNFDFGDKNFLKSVDEEILFIDDSIKFQSQEKDENFEENLSKTQENQQEERRSAPVCFKNIPNKLSEQISLPIENIKELSFCETFIISKKAKDFDESDIDAETDINKANEIGSACQMIEELSDGNILIFSIQQIFDSGERVVCESLSVVTKDLKLVHEKRIERKCNDCEFMEKTIFIVPQNNGYRLIKSMTKDKDTEHLEGNLEWKKCGDFLCSGATVLMMRKLVIENFKGCIQFYTCDIDGEFALSQNWFHGIEMKFMNEHAITVKRVDNLMIFDNERIEKISCFFMLQTGQLLKQISGSSDYFVYMNPFVDPYHQKYTKYLQENWKEDIQLLSMYFEYKAKRKEELKKKFESPQVKNLLNDYILSLIKCKPKGIMNFTIEFINKLEQKGEVHTNFNDNHR